MILVFGRVFLWRGCDVLARQGAGVMRNFLPHSQAGETGEGKYLTEWDTSLPFTDFS